MECMKQQTVENDRQRRVLELSVAVGETLLANGGEIFRVQDTMERIAAAFGVSHFHAYVLTNGLFASIDGGECCQAGAVRAVGRSTTHLSRVAAVNALSRDIAQGGIDIEQAFLRLQEIKQMPYRGSWARIVACGVGAGCFSYLFGGAATEMLAGFFVGLCLEPLRIFMERAAVGKVICNLLSAVWVALVSLLCVSVLGALGLAVSTDKVIVGGIIPLVPGIALTTGIRDIAGGDYLSGMIRAMDALLIGGSIALGVGVVLKLSVLLTGGHSI